MAIAFVCRRLPIAFENVHFKCVSMWTNTLMRPQAAMAPGSDEYPRQWELLSSPDAHKA